MQLVGRKCCSTPSILVGVLATTSCNNLLLLVAVPSDMLHLHVITWSHRI